MAQQRKAVTIPAYLKRRFFDHQIAENTYHGGICRDASDIPQGFLYDSVDMLVEQPGWIYKRGGWVRHSAVMAHPPVHWVGTIHSPTRVVAIDSNNDLYDVTSEGAPQATLLANIGGYPTENSPINMDNKLILTGGSVVKYIRYNPGADALQVHNLEGSPPVASRSCIHTTGVVLAAGTNDYTDTGSLQNRIWFEPTANDIREGRTNWDTTLSWIDNPHAVTGLASIGGVLLIFSARTVNRILGGDPPGTGHSDSGAGDMTFQPFLAVGALDARSIVYADEGVIFAGEDGVWWTNGSGVKSLTENDKGTGIQSYWRSLFPRFTYSEHNSRQIIGGMLNRDFYVCTILSNTGALVDSLLCHVPTSSWTRMSNFAFNSMASGEDEDNIQELYLAESETGYVSRGSPILYPSTTNMADGDGTDVTPTYTTRNISTGLGMKSYGFGWLSYSLNVPAGNPAATLQIVGLKGLSRNGSTDVRTLAQTGIETSSFVDRQRFNIYTDTQALWIKVTQQSRSASTGIQLLEAEERIYWPTADSLGR